MSNFLANAFSPMMLTPGVIGRVVEINLIDIPAGLTSVVSHEITAKVLTALMCEDVAFNRTNVALKSGDTIYCVIPSFRASEAREFTREEVTEAGFRCFQVWVC